MKFLKPENIVASCNIKAGQKATDLGCGSGFYSLALAKYVGNTGRVACVDIQDAKLAATKSITLQHNLNNVEVYKADLEKPLTSLPAGSEDVVFVASILHEVKNREAVLKNAYSLLKTGGHLVVVDWKVEASPFGPRMENRVSEHDIRSLLEGLGFRFTKELPTDLYHYAMVFQK